MAGIGHDQQLHRICAIGARIKLMDMEEAVVDLLKRRKEVWRRNQAAHYQSN